MDRISGTSLSKCLWNQCPSGRGMSVQVSVESLSKCSWNGCPSARGIPKLDVIVQTTNSLSGASHPNEATRAKYATTLAGALLRRIKAEEQARALGLPILESYQDPTMVTGVPVPSMESVAKAEALKQAQTAPPEPVLRKAAGELCPQSGWWFTPPQVNSRRYFQQGTPFPAIGDSNFGTTFWQWSPDQSNPRL